LTVSQLWVIVYLMNNANNTDLTWSNLNDYLTSKGLRWAVGAEETTVAHVHTVKILGKDRKLLVLEIDPPKGNMCW
jgi:hypothetical protein